MRITRGWFALFGVALAAPLVLLGLYAGAYCRMIRPTVPFAAEVGLAAPGFSLPEVVPLEARYEPRRLLGIDCARLFAPMNRLDRQLRPRQWEFRIPTVRPPLTPERERAVQERIDAEVRDARTGRP
ncbi:MAG TPA: hypothetical protein VHB77_19380 [Planctomycetaceae bacterium]|nr:hypothetical protein [Planctomycetaceae bacterium]